MGVHLGDGHGILVGTLPSLLGVHGDGGAGPEVVVEQVVVHPWESLLAVVEVPCWRLGLGLAAADPHLLLLLAGGRSSQEPCLFNGGRDVSLLSGWFLKWVGSRINEDG